MSSNRSLVFSATCGLTTLAILLFAPVMQAVVVTVKPATQPATRATTRPTTMQSPARFEKEIHAFELSDEKALPAEGGILFTGSSTIRRWTTLQQDFPGLPVLNRGFGGSMISDSIYFIDRIVTKYKPHVIVLYSGGNDINAGRSPERVFADFKAFVSNVRAKLPDVKIVYMGIGPSPKRWAQAEKQKLANKLIRDYMAAGTNFDYVDVWDEFLGPDGLPREEFYVADHHHNNADGYKIRTAILKSHLN